jgi:hypothetical protein
LVRKPPRSVGACIVYSAITVVVDCVSASLFHPGVDGWVCVVAVRDAWLCEDCSCRDGAGGLGGRAWKAVLVTIRVERGESFSILVDFTVTVVVDVVTTLFACVWTDGRIGVVAVDRS